MNWYMYKHKYIYTHVYQNILAPLLRREPKPPIGDVGFAWISLHVKSRKQFTTAFDRKKKSTNLSRRRCEF